MNKIDTLIESIVEGTRRGCMVDDSLEEAGNREKQTRIWLFSKIKTLCGSKNKNSKKQLGKFLEKLFDTGWDANDRI